MVEEDRYCIDILTQVAAATKTLRAVALGLLGEHRTTEDWRRARMLSVTWDTIRLFLHVLAATVWVGGQLTLAALVPALRRFGAEVPQAAARRFNQVAWVAFGILIVTGGWNVIAVRHQVSHSAHYRTTLIVKLVVVAISGVTAVLHARSRGVAGRAVFGALTGISALLALFLGVLLAG